MLPHDGSWRPSEPDGLVDAALWVAFAISVLLTLVWSLAGRPPGAGLFPKADKVFHAAAYATMFGTYVLAAVWRPGRGGGPYPATAVPLAAALVASGITIEVVQGEFLNRHADVWDVVAEVVGILGAIAFVRGLGWRSR